jgi:hypothetical protein
LYQTPHIIARAHLLLVFRALIPSASLIDKLDASGCIKTLHTIETVSAFDCYQKIEFVLRDPADWTASSIFLPRFV